MVADGAKRGEPWRSRIYETVELPPLPQGATIRFTDVLNEPGGPFVYWTIETPDGSRLAFGGKQGGLLRLVAGN